MKKTVTVLGVKYSIERRKYQDDKYMQDNSFCGYCDWVLRKIVICDINTYPGCEGKSAEWCRQLEKHTLRHEIVHAFFNESGLKDSSHCYDDAWAKNEELVDWIASQGERVYSAWQEASAL